MEAKGESEMKRRKNMVDKNYLFLGNIFEIISRHFAIGAFCFFFSSFLAHNFSTFSPFSKFGGVLMST